MSISDRTPTFYSYRLTGMDPLNGIGKIEGNEGYNQVPQGNPQHNQY